MTTSGSYSLSMNRDELLKSALRKIGAFESGETPDSDSMTEAAQALNGLLKHWQATGIHIWATTEATLFLQPDQTIYTLSDTSSDNAMESFTETSLTAAALSGATTITVDSASGIATTYYIGVQVDDGTIHWTTVNGAPAGTLITLTAALDDSASEGARVLVYQTKLVRPLKILSARLYDFESTIETPLTEFDRIEYQEMPNKSSTSTVNGYYYDRRGGANASGLLYIWPTSNTAATAVKMTVARPIQIFSAAGNTPDFPDEWHLATVWNLALELAPEYDVPESKIARIERNAMKYLAEVNWSETELTDIQFVPDSR